MDQRDGGPQPTNEFASAAALEAPGQITVGPFRIDRARYEALARDTLAFAIRPTRRNKLHWASWAIALAAEIILVVILRSGQTYAWERWLTRELQQVPGRRTIFDVTSTMTNSLSLGFLAIFLAIITLILTLGHRGAALLLLLTFPLHVLAQWPKALIDRPRPSDNFDGIVGVGGFQSFPSGHSEYVVTFYGFLAYLVMLHLERRWMRWAVGIGWVAFALATGFGRIALGRHWPIDVLASYVIGLGLLSGMIWLHTALRYAKRLHPRKQTDSAVID
jgi:membrane-associated phospholipid phosphatase